MRRAAWVAGAVFTVLLVAGGGFLALSSPGFPTFGARPEPKTVIVDGEECIDYGDHSGYSHPPLFNECRNLGHHELMPKGSVPRPRQEGG